MALARDILNHREAITVQCVTQHEFEVVPVTATGLFLGAAASFEAGMPLVWDLTAEIRAGSMVSNRREI